METDDGAWFAPRRLGYGAGLPIRWQGWAALAAYLAVLLAASLLPEAAPRWGWAVMMFIQLTATVAMIVVAKRRTRGGWRWRWGE